jgi:hypothetical protein
VMWTVEWKMDVAGIKETVLEHGFGFIDGY